MKKMIPDYVGYINSTHYYRGLVIGSFTNLEKTIETILIDEFITDDSKKVDFMMIILDRMTFEAKRTSLKSILDKKVVTGGFIKTKNNSYPNGKLFDEIRLLQDQRNYFAHFPIILPSVASYNVIGLGEMRDNFKPKMYTKKDIESLINRITKASQDLIKLFN